MGDDGEGSRARGGWWETPAAATPASSPGLYVAQPDGHLALPRLHGLLFGQPASLGLLASTRSASR